MLEFRMMGMTVGEIQRELKTGYKIKVDEATIKKDLDLIEKKSEEELEKEFGKIIVGKDSK